MLTEHHAMKRAELMLSLFVATLGAVAALVGVITPSIYRDAPAVLPQAFGQDVVTLVCGVPLLLIATAATWRGSLSGRMLWLGALGYMAYAYGTYALWARWNPLFLVYVALFGLSLYGVALGLVRTDAARVHAAAVTGRAPARLVAGYLAVTALLVSALWLTEELRALVRHEVPATLVQLETATNVIHVFDLGVVMPAFVITAVLLVRRRPWGSVLAGVLLVKAGAIGLAVLAMIVFMARSGYPADPGFATFFTALTLAAAALAWRFLAPLARTGRGWSPARPVERTI
jgi:hypothetical protein